MFSERTQVLLAARQRRELERIAAERGVSLGAVIREAVDSFIGRPRRTRADALQSVVALEAPVDDWGLMEREIDRGALR